MEISLKRLSREDCPILQVLLEKCSDFLTFQDEEPVEPSAAQDLFDAGPEGFQGKGKVVFGIFRDQQQLIGVFDLIKGYSDPQVLSLGLMLLESSYRGNGIGSKAYKLLEEWAVTQKLKKIRLGVLFGNDTGLRFWESMGYIETGEVKPYLSNKVRVLEKSIGTASKLDQSDRISLRRTQLGDLKYVLASENAPDNRPYVGLWSLEQHQASLDNPDILHIIVERKESREPVGYAIMAGINNPNRSIELKRIVITEKGQGLGKETLELIKRVSFEQLKAHRLWLDVRSNNPRAYAVYKSKGFMKEGTQRECIYIDNEYISLSIMSILESEYNLASK